MNRLTAVYQKILFFFRDMHVAWKFTLAYSFILALPIIITGIYISKSTTQTIIHQSGLLSKQSLFQKREVINQKIESINRTSISIAYNAQILEYFERPYENNLQGYENYVTSFAPVFEGFIIQNRYVFGTMFYVRNYTFPNAWNGIYHLNTVEDDSWYKELLEDESLSAKWSTLHDTKNELYSRYEKKEKVFSLCRKLVSFSDKSVIGLLEIEIPAKVLFENLGKSQESAEFFLVFDEEGNIVSDNTFAELPEMWLTNVVPTLSEKELNGVYKFENEQLTIYSLPLESIGCRLVSITPLKYFTQGSPDHRMVITAMIIIALIIFGAIIHIVTNRLTRRLKLFVKGLKSVRDDNINIKMPVENHDEFGELTQSFNHMTERIHGLIERVYKAQITQKESELKALQAQINPHFLYNTLSTISWMARKINAPNIDNLSLQLSQFYRLVLSKGNSIIAVEDEINLLKAYVEIEKIRFENMFHVEYDLDEKAFSYRMVKIILQPIAENTINHGIAPKDCKGTMVVRLRQDEDSLYFTIIDDGVGMNRSTLENICRGQIVKRRESGYAVHNIMERLKSVYGEDAHVTIFSRPGIGCTVNIVIPKSPKLPNF